MPQVVEALPGQACLLGELLHVPRDVLGPVGGPVLPGEHQPRVGPGGAGDRALGVLAQLVLEEGPDGVAVDVDAPVLAARGLRLRDHQLAADVDDLLPDGDDPGAEVDVLPAEPDGLAAAEACEGHHFEHGAQSVGGGEVEESPELSGLPGAHLGP